MTVRGVACFAFVASILLALSCAQAAPNAPLWPAVWSSAFFETTQIIFQGNTTGYFYYDSTQQAARTDRANGNGDRYCESVHPLTNTPCSHYVWQGYRYLHFPALNECCMCCTAANGCGIVKRDWLVNGTYQGTAVVNNTKCDTWEQDGLQKNLWYQSVANATPVLLDQQPNDQQYWAQETFSTNPIPKSTLMPPSICSPSNTCSFLSICTIARKYSLGNAPADHKLPF